MNVLERKTGFRLDKNAVERLSGALENYHELQPSGAIGTKQACSLNGEEELIKDELFKHANDIIAILKRIQF